MRILIPSISVVNGKTLVVRTCVLEDMNSQCGTFKFQNDTLKGCLLTCDYDGCNAATSTSEFKHATQTMLLAAAAGVTRKLCAANI